MNTDIVNLKTPKNNNSIKKEIPVDKSEDNNLIHQILNEQNIDPSMIPSINPNINRNQNQYLVNNSLVNNILKDIDTSQTYINKKDDNSLVNNILKDIDTTQTYINKKMIIQ